MFQSNNNRELARLLENVFWLGGSPCAGKTSIARMLVEKYDLQYYACDHAFYQHNEIVTSENQPTFYRVMHLSSEELWMRPVEQQTHEEIEIYREEFPLILQDLLALPDDRPILAEGAALLPDRVTPLLNDSRRAIWMVPSAEFQMQHYSQRKWIGQVLKDTSDPHQAFRNWMQRDIAYALFVRDQARQRGMRVVVVDGTLSIARNFAEVEAHFRHGLLHLGENKAGL